MLVVTQSSSSDCREFVSVGEQGPSGDHAPSAQEDLGPWSAVFVLQGAKRKRDDIEPSISATGRQGPWETKRRGEGDGNERRNERQTGTLQT